MLHNLRSNFFSVLFVWLWLLVEPKYVALKAYIIVEKSLVLTDNY